LRIMHRIVNKLNFEIIECLRFVGVVLIMAAFSEDNLIKKLADLNNSQQSIQTLSLWLIHHRKHSKAITEIWLKELKKGER